MWLRKFMESHPRFTTWLIFSVSFVIGFKLNNIVFKKPMNWEHVVFLIIATAIIYLVNYTYHKFRKP